jgi:bacterioferritin
MDKTMQTLIDGLNEDLANEYTAVIMYTYNAATVSGLNRQVLKPFFDQEVPDELGHASYLAEKISMLGGTPVVEPAPFKTGKDVKEMLELALEAEKDTIKRYKQRLEQADEAGEIALKVQLEDMIADETRHKEELERLLEDPRLG